MIERMFHKKKLAASACLPIKSCCQLQRKWLFITGCVLLMWSTLGIAGEIDSQINKLQTDIERSRGVSRKVFGKNARFVPIPIPISNPSIGTGLAVALLYMHPQKSEKPNAPTTTSGVMGMYTNTESWAVGALHDGYYRDDQIRFRFPAVHGEFNLDFYGIGNESPFRDNPVEYNAVTNAVIPRLLFRLPWNNWFLGGEYRLLNIDAQFNPSNLPSNTPGIGQQTQTAGFGLVSVFDSRDSNFWPLKGNWLELTATNNGAYTGGDYEYFKLISKWAQYFPLIDTVTYVYRLDGQFINGDAPFWDLSRVRLRGYTGGQLVDNLAVTAQTEVRWNFYQRWTTLAFVGGGRIADTVGDLSSAPTNWAGGGGLKYMLIKDQKLSIGIDVAYAEGGSVSVYFQVGDWLAN